jgi:hypothetical protein
MPRRFRNALLAVPIVLLALGLASCFDDAGDCPTCPAVDGGRIDVLLPQNGAVDSIHTTIDHGPRFTVRRGQRFSYPNLKAGSHEVTITRWFYIDQVLTSKSSTLVIMLARGETRTIVFHNDFPLVAWADPPGASPGVARRARPSPRVG